MGVGWGVPPGLGDLGSVFGPDLVEAVVDKTGCRERRVRRLPSDLMVVFGLARSLFCPEPYREVLRRLTWSGGHTPAVAGKAAVFRARLRVGPEPFHELLTQVGPQAGPTTPGAFWRGRHLMVLDGTTVPVADTAANDQVFGRLSGSRGAGAFPLAKVMVLIESGTHVVLDAAVGGCRTGERELAGPLIDRLAPGDLLLADAGLPSVRMCRAISRQGADVLFRVPDTWGLVPAKVLADGSYLAVVAGSGSGGAAAERDKMQLRVIEYRLDDPGRDGSIRYRLVCTITDPGAAPAPELAALYHERWVRREAPWDRVEVEDLHHRVVAAAW